jgi:CHAT domain-containing protein
LALGGSLKSLPQTAVESNLIGNTFQQAFPSGKVVRLLDRDATETNVRQQLKGDHFSYIHFAVHGFEDLSYRALALSTPAAPTADDDGFLSLPEITALPRMTGCELVLLSACETNYGPQRPLEAGSTLSQAFICAGARRVVSSDWSVDDRAASQLIGELMNKVTNDLSQGRDVDYAQALQAAKKVLRHGQQTSAPRDWAAFVLIGPPTSGEDRHRQAPLATTRP